MNTIDRMLDGWDEAHWMKQASYFQGRACLTGRLSMALGYIPNAETMVTEEWYRTNKEEWRRVMDCLSRVINEQYGTISVSGFNDEQGRTFDEIVAVCEKASVVYDEKYADIPSRTGDI